MQPLSLLGPLDVLGTNVKWLVLGLAVVNMGTRMLAHSQHERQAEASDDAEEMSRNLLHETTNVLLILTAFYMTTVAYHGGAVMSLLVIGLVLTDVFEFEARKVEARRGEALDKPKGALVASLLVLGYAAFQTMFFLVQGIVGRIIVL